jgi:hypothetical protein
LALVLDLEFDAYDMSVILLLGCPTFTIDIKSTYIPRLWRLELCDEVRCVGKTYPQRHGLPRGSR